MDQRRQAHIGWGRTLDEVLKVLPEDFYYSH